MSNSDGNQGILLEEKMLKNIKLYKELLEEKVEIPAEVSFEMGMIFFNQGMHKNALDAFVSCHRLNFQLKDIENLIMEAYYQPNIEEFKSRYEKNVQWLSEYIYFSKKDFPDFAELQYSFIPCSETNFYIFDREKEEFTKSIDLAERENYFEEKAKDVVLIQNEYRIESISACEENTRDPKPFLWSKIPFYLYYDSFEEFVQYLQIVDFSEILNVERVVFLFGQKEVAQWFSEPQATYPEVFLSVGGQNNDLCNFISQIYQKRQKEVQKAKVEIDKYYDGTPIKKIAANIKSGTPRILFITSRFTTALQYYIRDCMLACDNLGIPNRLIIEKSDIYRNNMDEIYLCIMEFKPDIIFIIDHFRWEYPWLPDNIIFVSWIQDPLPHIMSKESARKTTENDYLLNLYFTSEEFFQLGYPEDRLIDAPVLANHHIYKTYQLTKQETDEFSTDVCLFSNAGDPKKGLEEFIKLFDNSLNLNTIRKVFESVYAETYKLIYNEQPLYTVEDYAKIIEKWSKKFGLEINDLNKISETYRLFVGFRILRSVPLEWLHEKGYKMKLWGREWVEHPVLNKYAQGVAQNGETLSKIINASKIVLGTNSGITTHPRVFETILSNSFYLGVNIPKVYDWANIRRFMEEDKEIVFFYSKEDLYKKIDYYLEKEDERKKIIDRGKKKILESLTYEALMKRVIQEVAFKLETD